MMTTEVQAADTSFAMSLVQGQIWVEPDGTIHDITHEGKSHGEWALDYLGQEQPAADASDEDTDEQRWHAMEELFHMGWMRMGTFLRLGQPQTYLQVGGPLTKHHLDIAQRWLHAHQDWIGPEITLDARGAFKTMEMKDFLALNNPNDVRRFAKQAARDIYDGYCPICGAPGCKGQCAPGQRRRAAGPIPVPGHMEDRVFEAVFNHVRDYWSKITGPVGADRQTQIAIPTQGGTKVDGREVPYIYVTPHTVPGGHYALQGAHMMDGRVPEIVVEFNGSKTGEELLKALGDLSGLRLRSWIRHELAHVFDRLEDGSGTDPWTDPAAYYNDPVEVRAYASQVYRHVMDMRDYYATGASWIKKSGEKALWEVVDSAVDGYAGAKIRKYMSPANRRKLLQVVYRAIMECIEHPSERVASLKTAAEAGTLKADLMRIRPILRTWVGGGWEDGPQLVRLLEKNKDILAKFKPTTPLRLWRNERIEGPGGGPGSGSLNNHGWEDQYTRATAWSVNRREAETYAAGRGRRLVTAIVPPEDMYVSIPLVDHAARSMGWKSFDPLAQSEVIVKPNPSFLSQIRPPVKYTQEQEAEIRNQLLEKLRAHYAPQVKKMQEAKPEGAQGIAARADEQIRGMVSGIPAEELPERVREWEGKLQEWSKSASFIVQASKTLYHGTTVERAKNIMRYGLTPDVGDLVQTAYGDAEGYDFEELTFAADRPDVRRSVLSAILHAISAEGHPITDNVTAIRNWGAVVVIREGEDVMDHRPDTDNPHDYTDYPLQVEPGDYFSRDSVDVDDVITGPALVRWLQRNGAQLHGPMDTIPKRERDTLIGWVRQMHPNEPVQNIIEKVNGLPGMDFRKSWNYYQKLVQQKGKAAAQEAPAVSYSSLTHVVTITLGESEVAAHIIPERSQAIVGNLWAAQQHVGIGTRLMLALCDWCKAHDIQFITGNDASANRESTKIRQKLPGKTVLFQQKHEADQTVPSGADLWPDAPEAMKKILQGVTPNPSGNIMVTKLAAALGTWEPPTFEQMKWLQTPPKLYAAAVARMKAWQFPLTIYRAVKLPNEEALRTHEAGIFWTDQLDRAQFYTPAGKRAPGEKYVLRAEVGPHVIDWDATFNANCEPQGRTGAREQEIKLHANAPVVINGIMGPGETEFSPRRLRVTAAHMKLDAQGLAFIRKERSEIRLEETGVDEAASGQCGWVSEVINVKFGLAIDAGFYLKDGPGTPHTHSDHVWNVLPDGSIFDATHDQFGPPDILTAHPGSPQAARYHAYCEDPYCPHCTCMTCNPDWAIEMAAKRRELEKGKKQAGQIRPVSTATLKDGQQFWKDRKGKFAKVANDTYENLKRRVAESWDQQRGSTGQTWRQFIAEAKTPQFVQKAMRELVDDLGLTYNLFPGLKLHISEGEEPGQLEASMGKGQEDLFETTGRTIPEILDAATSWITEHYADVLFTERMRQDVHPDTRLIPHEQHLEDVRRRKQQEEHDQVIEGESLGSTRVPGHPALGYTPRSASKKSNPEADAETERIRERAKTPEARKPHKFQAAEWTLPNGHPRCKVCGDEEPVSGMCPGSKTGGSQTLRLYRGLTQPFDPQHDTASTDAPTGYSTWTDNPELARQYAGPKGFVYALDLPRAELKPSYIDEDPKSPTYGDRALVYQGKPCGINGVTGHEFLVYTDHEHYDPAQVHLLQPKTAATRDEAFKAWFGASKAVHPDGTPMLFYHGTSKDQAFTAFKDNRRGIFFTPDPQGASDYAANNDSQGSKYNPDTRRWEQVHTAPRVIPVYLRMVNPYKLEGAEAEVYFHASNYAQYQRDLADRVKMQGHDGIIYPDGSWVVFDPRQVKSAIGNSGAFNPNDKKLTASTQVPIGMNVNDSEHPWTQMILQGTKTMETRNSDSLRPHVGERVGIVRTGQGPAMLVGYCDLGEPVVYRSNEEFRADQQLHQVPAASGYDIPPGGVKFGYPLSNVEPVDPPQPVISQGRVFRRLAATLAPEPNDIGLMTLDQFMQQQNPDEVQHPSEAYNWTLEQMNNSYNGHWVGKDAYKGEIDCYRYPKGFVLRKDRAIVGVSDGHTLWLQHPLTELPDTYWDRSPKGYTKLEFGEPVQVKYPAEHLGAITDSKIRISEKYPKVLQTLPEGYVLRSAGDKPNAGLALVHNDMIVGVAQDEWGATLISVAQEYRGHGIGNILRRYWGQMNPDYRSGGYTPAGRRMAIQAWSDRVRELLAHGVYSELLASGKMTREQVQAILKGIQGRSKGLSAPPAPVAVQGKLQLYMDEGGIQFVLYDDAFLQDQDPKHIKAYGFMRDGQPGTFFYRLDYDPAYRDAATTIALQMGKNEGEPLYVGKGYGDLLEIGDQPVERKGDYVTLTKDLIDLLPLARRERAARKKVDRYGQIENLLLEEAEGKAWDETAA